MLGEINVRLEWVLANVSAYLFQSLPLLEYSQWRAVLNAQTAVIKFE